LVIIISARLTESGASTEGADAKLNGEQEDNPHKAKECPGLIYKCRNMW